MLKFQFRDLHHCQRSTELKARRTDLQF